MEPKNGFPIIAKIKSNILELLCTAKFIQLLKTFLHLNKKGNNKQFLKESF